MSGKIRIGGLVFVAGLIVLLAGIFFGQGAPGDPCGGNYAGEGLKAMFLPLYGATICNGGQCNILNDMEGVYYRYQKPGGDCVYLFRAGHVIVGIGNSGRHVVMNFEQIDPGECPFAHLSPYDAQEFMLRTDVGFAPTRGYGSDPNVLVLTSTNLRLNFGGMTPGMTYYCQTSIKFRVANDPALYENHFQAKVFYGILDETGALGWRITPIDEPYYCYTVTKVGKKLVPVEPPTWHPSSVYAQIGSDYCPDDYGTSCLPFKLILGRLK